MTSKELRQKYLDFFKSKGHAIIPSASLIPENDPTVLFTTAGMHPLVPYLMGEKHPLGKRIADCQKCIRTTDIEDVGDNRHLTFFEMLGNWSLGDYFKKEAIEWSWEFMTSKEWLGLDPKRIFVTVFMGNDDSPIDEESIGHWKRMYESVGMKADVCDYNKPIASNVDYRIFPLATKDNWWGPAGETGPCGPCSEMFYDVRPEAGPLELTFDEEVDRGRIIEIWNDVFMEFNKTGPGKFEKLPAANVDTGMGLERTLTVLMGKANVFETEIFANEFKRISELSGKQYGQSDEINKAMRIVADHLKAATFIIGDDKGITPSNVGAGYIVRRLIRRAVRYGKMLGITETPWTKEIAKVVAHDLGDIYPEIRKNIDYVIEQLNEEEAKFTKTLDKGLKVMQGIKWKEIKELGDREDPEILNKANAKIAFDLYQTYGFPLEMIEEELFKVGMYIDDKEFKLQLEKGFKKELEKHQELSRTASAGMFKGGLADAGEQSRKYHTATHLLLAALRKVLGDHIYQKGSNITADRLRLDFNNPEKMTVEQIKQVEDLVNEAIKKDYPVIMEELTLDEAKQKGALGVFESKYGERVKVYTIGKDGDVFSMEICGGPHVEHTGELGVFKIQKEESSSAGVRRIKAVLE
ncbi:MAG: alanine--tRNA ligase [Patescibacteria group bacterium]|jgi:alanyl-tRNA synthetase